MLKSLRLQKVILSIVGLLTVVAACSRIAAAAPPDQFFEAKVRPLLIEHCITCHGGDKPDAGLSLEFREGWAGRDVIVPHAPEKSLIIAAVRFESDKLKMPPEDSGMRRLTESEIQVLEKWIADGAVDPRVSQTSSTGPRRRSKQFQITEQDKAHWAYQPLATATNTAPTSNKASGSTSVPAYSPIERAAQIDKVVDDKLAQIGLLRNPPATPRELVRRAYFDLWGLPPEPDVVAAFERNPTSLAWNELLERLLDSPYYGQRWGRYWLDWVRYAETNGYERDGIKPNAWRYRDYVIDAFNSDKPYNRFLTEQLAGDLLIKAEDLSAENQPQVWREAIIATGFFRLHVWDDEPDSSDVAEMDDLDDIMITTGAAMMGMTLGCARCHDHKFDPLSQVDYYSMLDLFRDIDPYGLSKKGGGGRGTGKIERFLVSDATLQQWQTEKEREVQQLESRLANASEDQKESLNQQLKQRKESQPPFEKALAINPPPGHRKPTFVLARGDIHSPGAKVDPQLPELFRASHDGTINDRLTLANWLTAPSNPLTARVLANRIWLKHFGAGIVTTPDDFGYTGIAPSNIQLLDILSTQLIESGWSIKAMHRAIMLSKTYQMSSRTSNVVSAGSDEAQSLDPALKSTVSASEASATALKDPENQYFWRQNLRRLDAEALRDSILRYAGTLHPKSSGPSVYSNLSQEIRDTANPVSLSSWGKNTDDEQNCRSVFLIVKRSLKDPILESFDFANSISPVGQRPITTVAPQSLMMLNDEFVQKQSERLASSVLADSKITDRRIALLWSIVYQRKPRPSEHQSIEKFIASPSQSSRDELAIWTSLCRALINSNECIYID